MSAALSNILEARGIAQAELARQLGVHKSAVTRWTKWGMPIPAARVADIERLTGIPRHELRPDIFAPATSKRASA